MNCGNSTNAGSNGSKTTINSSVSLLRALWIRGQSTEEVHRFSRCRYGLGRTAWCGVHPSQKLPGGMLRFANQSVSRSRMKPRQIVTTDSRVSPHPCCSILRQSVGIIINTVSWVVTYHCLFSRFLTTEIGKLFESSWAQNSNRSPTDTVELELSELEQVIDWPYIGANRSLWPRICQ